MKVYCMDGDNLVTSLTPESEWRLMPSETSVLSWKTGDCRSRGLAAPVKLPSESEVISSCSESLELATQDGTRHGATAEWKIHKKNRTLHYCMP